MTLQEANLEASKDQESSVPKLWYGSDEQVGPRAQQANGLDSIQKTSV